MKIKAGGRGGGGITLKEAEVNPPINSQNWNFYVHLKIYSQLWRFIVQIKLISDQIGCFELNNRFKL
jgi:hypothetical protein